MSLQDTRQSIKTWLKTPLTNPTQQERSSWFKVSGLYQPGCSLSFSDLCLSPLMTHKLSGNLLYLILEATMYESCFLQSFLPHIFLCLRLSLDLILLKLCLHTLFKSLLAWTHLHMAAEMFSLMLNAFK